MDGVAQYLIALVADVDAMALPGLETDRGGAGVALQGGGVRETLGAATDFPQQPRPQGLGHAGQRTKQVVVGMPLEERFDLPAVFVQLQLQGLKQSGQTQGQQTLGGSHGGGTAELAGLLENLQPG